MAAVRLKHGECNNLWLMQHAKSVGDAAPNSSLKEIVVFLQNAHSQGDLMRRGQKEKEGVLDFPNTEKI